MRVTVTVILCLGIGSTLATNLPQYTSYKSFETGFRECGVYHLVCDATIEQYIKDGYPKSDQVKELIYCALVNLRAFDPETGVAPNVMQNYFKPCPEDCNYEQRTQDCLSHLLKNVPPCDIPGQAYAAFSCYYHEHGNIDPTDQFLPYSKLEQREVLTFTQSVLNIPYCVIQQYSTGNILTDCRFPEILYTWAVRSGYYTPGQGISLPYLYTTYGIPELISKKTYQCVARVAQKYCNSDDVTIVWYTFVDCLRQYLPVDKFLQAYAQDVVKTVASTGQQPC